ncbi:glucosamine-6-phosphate deaminase [Arthrobacter sp. JSM 101049]|uniref:glucosamine-6-phosphate deaminase n=1 Tax=Arthrobacter sp. JSM 101049 TaxID=929097 RepID=UPI00356901B6
MQVLIAASAAETAGLAAAAVISGWPRWPGDGPAMKRAPVLGLATGSSPLGLYAALGRAVARSDVDFSTALGFALDEYVGLPANHPQSYRNVLEREVCRVIGLPVERLHVPDASTGSAADLRLRAAAYEQQISDAGGIDVQILGIGANGHLGFNEPGSALASRTRVKRLAARTREDNARFFPGAASVPTHCLTQGLGTIARAHRLVLVANGPGKAAAVAAALEGPLSGSCPASILQWHPDAVVVLDAAAAAGLRNRAYYDDAAAGLGMS